MLFCLFYGLLHADRVEGQVKLFLDFWGVVSDVLTHGLVFHELFQLAFGDHKFQQLGSLVFLGVFAFLLHLLISRSSLTICSSGSPLGSSGLGGL